MGIVDGARAFAQVALEQWKSPEEVARLQEERLKTALSLAYGTEHYRRAMDGAGARPSGGIDSLLRLPMTSKKELRANEGSFMTPNPPGGKVLSHDTTGSTGMPLRIWMDQRAATLRTALMLSNYFSSGVTPLSLMAKVLFEEGHEAGISGRLYGVIPWFGLSILDDEAKSLSLIGKRRADTLCAYPSVAALLAKANAKRQTPLRLRRVLCGAEVLYPEWRGLIRESFSCPVFNMYGSREFGPMAWECPEEHSMHVNSGSFFMEILDSRGKPCRNGVGHVTLTSLCNSAMPLVRYDIGDLASWGRPCSCGRGLPVLKAIEGRADDLVLLPGGRFVSPLSFRFTDLKCMEALRIYQLVQERESQFVFRYVPIDGELSAPAKDAIRARIALACKGEAISVEFEHVSQIKRNRRGKLNRLVSKVAWRRNEALEGGKR